MLPQAPGEWTLGEEVHVVTLRGESFLRSDANRLAADNLDNLPPF